MMKATVFLRRLSDHINIAVLWAGAGFMCLMVLLVAIQIVARYALQDAPAWTEEGARYAMVWSAMLAATSSFHGKLDPALVTIGASASVLMQSCARIARFVCVAVFCGALLYYSPGMIARSALRETQTLGFNLAFVTAVVPIFAAIVLFHAFVQLIDWNAAESLAEREE